MARVYKRRSDKARGKAGKYTCVYKDSDGRQRSCVGFSDKSMSFQLANSLEQKAKQVSAGMVEPGQDRRDEAAVRPIGAHIDAYRLHLIAKGGTADHAADIASALGRLLASEKIHWLSDITPSRVQAALGRWKATKAARTCNHALGAVKAFCRWLDEDNRIVRVPRGLLSIKPYNERADRRRVRRALTREELGRLLNAAERGPTLVARRPARGHSPSEWITGKQRAVLYSLAMTTGFRANELRSLTTDSFSQPPEPAAVILEAKHSKNGKRVVQPVPDWVTINVGEYLMGVDPGKPIMTIPVKTAQMLRVDLEAAGIPYRDEQGRALDFHALRVSYVTNLVRSGANPKVVQRLARHSSISLTMDVYAQAEDSELREAIEGVGTEKEKT